MYRLLLLRTVVASLVLLLLACPTWAAIAFVSTTNSVANTRSAATITTSVTVSGCTDCLMVIANQYGSSSTTDDDVTGVTFNTSENATLACHQQITSGANILHADIWYLVNPTATTADVVVTWAGTGNSRAQGYSVLLLSGVDQASPVDVACASTTQTLSASISVNHTTLTNNSWIVDSLHSSATTPTVGANQTSRVARSLSNDLNNEAAGVSTIHLATAGLEAMDWTLSLAGIDTIASTSFKEAATASAVGATGCGAAMILLGKGAGC